MPKNNEKSDISEKTEKVDFKGEKSDSKLEAVAEIVRGFGWKSSPALPSDQHFGAKIGINADEPPAQASNQDLVDGVVDQLSVESCIANAGSSQLACEFKRLGLKVPRISRLFAYYGLRVLSGDQYADGGGYVRNFYGALNKFGFCSEQTYPYSADKNIVNAQPSAKAYMESFDNQVKVGYYRIDFGDMTIGGSLTTYQYARQRAIKQAIARRHTVVFGTAVDVDTFHKVRDMGPIDAPSSSATVGGHAMLIVAYDDEGCTVLNSWGTDWGVNGFTKLSWSYILDPRTSDLWVLELEHAPAFYGSTQ